ncbi:MAG: PfkB family carbohydrate kinase [Pseudonocardia sp.]
MTGIRRLLGLGSVVVDLVLHVDRLPEPGGDVLARSAATAVGGGLNALAAAAGAGLPAAYAGGHGTGPFGDLVRGALASHDVPALLPPTADQDTGFCVVLVDDTGERTFATTVGAEGRLTAEALAAVRPAADDAVYVSGYDLVYPHAAAIAGWVSSLPPGTSVVFDPGPLVGDIDPALLDAVLARTSWLSLNGRETQLVADEPDPRDAVTALLRRAPGLAGVVVRLGPWGALVGLPEAALVAVPGVPVAEVVDTNGAGDVHVGTFVAALADGADPVAAAAIANGAAASLVSTRGPGRMGP